jgi:hypothetical protein
MDPRLRGDDGNAGMTDMQGRRIRNDDGYATMTMIKLMTKYSQMKEQS